MNVVQTHGLSEEASSLCIQTVPWCCVRMDMDGSLGFLRDYMKNLI